MIRENLQNIYKELPPDVKLVAVSKFHPVEAMLEAVDAGQLRFGENRPQEFQKKVLNFREQHPEIAGRLEWHFIGHLQTNKLKMVLPYADLVQSRLGEDGAEDGERAARASHRRRADKAGFR